MKKALSIILVLVMMASLFPAAFAEDPEAPVTGLEIYVSYSNASHEEVTTDPQTQADNKWQYSGGVLTITGTDVAAVSAGTDSPLTKIVISTTSSPANVISVWAWKRVDIEVNSALDKGLSICKMVDFSMNLQLNAGITDGGLKIVGKSAATADTISTNNSRGIVIANSAVAESAISTTDSLVFDKGTISILKNIPSGESSPKAFSATGSVTLKNTAQVTSTVRKGAETTGVSSITNVDVKALTVESGAVLNVVDDASSLGVPYTGIKTAEALVNSGTTTVTINSAGQYNLGIDCGSLNFQGGELESSIYGTPGTDIPSAIKVSESGTVSVAATANVKVGDSAAAAERITDPTDKSSYAGKMYAKFYIPETPANEIELDKNSLTLTVGGTYPLTPTKLSPAGTTVTYSVNEAGKGSVEVGETSGIVTAKAVTSNPAIITARTAEGAEATCEVTVVSPAATAVDIYDPSSDIYSLGNVGALKTFRASVTPAWTSGNQNDITWTSSDPNVVRITSTEEHGTVAHVLAVGSGSASVTASCGGKSDIVSVVVISDYKFTSPTGKLIWYYDRTPQYNLEFSTSIPYQGIRKVVIQAGNRDYDFTSSAMQNTYGTVTIPYSALYGTFGRQTTTMTLKVYYGTGVNDYIYKNLYYRSIYDSPLTADTDMTWAYVTMLISGLFISASPWILKKRKARTTMR